MTKTRNRKSKQKKQADAATSRAGKASTRGRKAAGPARVLAAAVTPFINTTLGTPGAEMVSLFGGDPGVRIYTLVTEDELPITTNADGSTGAVVFPRSWDNCIGVVTPDAFGNISGVPTFTGLPGTALLPQAAQCRLEAVRYTYCPVDPIGTRAGEFQISQVPPLFANVSVAPTTYQFNYPLTFNDVSSARLFVAHERGWEAVARPADYTLASLFDFSDQTAGVNPAGSSATSLDAEATVFKTAYMAWPMLRYVGIGLAKSRQVGFLRIRRVWSVQMGVAGGVAAGSLDAPSQMSLVVPPTPVSSDIMQTIMSRISQTFNVPVPGGELVGGVVSSIVSAVRDNPSIFASLARQVVGAVSKQADSAGAARSAGAMMAQAGSWAPLEYAKREGGADAAYNMFEFVANDSKAAEAAFEMAAGAFGIVPL